MPRSRMLLVALAIAVVAVAATALGTARPAGSQTFQCYIQDPPPSPVMANGAMYGQARTVCQSPAQKLQVVVCLARYAGSVAPRGCSVATCYSCTALTGFTSTVCDYTRFLYTWRVSAYAIATIGGGTYKSPVALSNGTNALCF